ncbi:MAG: heavy metal-associated domain-containing protein [Oscillospiraceae bacterium]|nr:heavy metal-associated domain-containing protein [Oscillospiraceae bacterium]
MTKTFTLEHLDCANCAAKMERKIAKLKGVREVAVTFMTKKMTIDTDDAAMDAVIAQAEKIIHKLEPQVVLVERR